MSLINDAIKQANKANKERAASGASPAAATSGMHAAEARGIQPSGGSLTSMMLIAGIVVFVLLGGAFLFLSMRGNRSLNEAVPDQGEAPAIAPATAGSKTATAPTTTPPSAPANISSSRNPVADALTNPLPPTFHPAPTATQPDSTVPANTTSTTTAAGLNGQTTTPQPAGPRPFPELKLQGIYYRLNNPSVMINGQTLEIGDIIGNARVTRIERKEVTLELDGRTKVLRLQ